MGRTSVFTKDEEALAKQVKALSKHFYDISPTEIKKCAFKYPEEKKLNTHFLQPRKQQVQIGSPGFSKEIRVLA
jgi:hypothetical protein